MIKHSDEINFEVYKYVIISNVDIMLPTDFFEKLINYSIQDNTAWLAPKIYSYKEKRDRNPEILQKPSKLIDYGITKRPFYSCIKNTFDKKRFEQFLKKDYSSFKVLDISKYSIDIVANQFLSLIKK